MDNNIFFSIILIIGTLLSLNVSKYFLTKIGSIKKVTERRIYYVARSIQVIILIVSFFILAIIWSVSLSTVLVVASSIFTIIGVALFAQWSILSNITSSIIIFFTFPTRIGDTIKIIDGDNSVTGVIVEITLFQIELLDTEGNTISYPNNLFIQRPIKKINNIQNISQEEVEIKKDD
ncbi:mechanosensitive ion channel family protein [bacterium]|nr:mechanosensitive ion channel family protein [bacterium]MBU1994088.1 mechanosensitive ion channel family protein [bacterium]